MPLTLHLINRPKEFALVSLNKIIALVVRLKPSPGFHTFYRGLLGTSVAVEAALT